MPEWYNWRHILQRPGQETSTIGDKPNEYSYQLQVPEFKISTVTNPEYSVEKGLVTRKARDAYDAAYKEYLEQHPSQTSVGYNPYIGTQYNPDVQRQQAAHLYAQNKSGYYTSDPTALYKESDKKFAKFSEGVLGTMLFAPELAYGLGGAALRIGGGMAGGAVGGYVGSEVGKALDNTFETNFWQPTLGTVGGLWGWGKGARLGYNAGLKGIQFGASKGFVPHDWLASQKMKLDALRNAGLNWEPSKGTVNRTFENVPELQERPLQLTGHFGKVKYYGPTMGKTTAATSNSRLIDFDDIIRQPSRIILDRYGFKNKSEMYNSGNQEAIKAYEDMLVKTLQDWRANPENSNLTLVASPTAIANPSNTGFYFDNVPSIPSRDIFIARNVGRGGTSEASAAWYDSLIERNPNLKIDNRFVSEIEKLPYQTPKVFQGFEPQKAFAFNPEWEGLEIPEITAQHIGNQGKVLRWFESGNSKISKVPIKEASKKTSNWQKFLKLSQQEQDDFVRRWNGESFQGFATLKGDKQALGRFRSWINSRK